MTVIIPSYQHRDAMMRLIESLRMQFDADPHLAVAADVVVVIDGSTDGSKEAADSVSDYPVPLTVLWQDHRGPGVARNLGLGAAQGEVVLFLDDDVVLSADLLARHRTAHSTGTSRVVQGPCLVPSTTPDLVEVRAHYDDLHERLARTRYVTRYRDFSPANTSGPIEVFRGVGGFDERFEGYGLEDWELCVRLLRDGVTIEYLPEAIAWHRQELSVRRMCDQRRCEGRNLVRMATLHPDLVDELCPPAGFAPSSHPWLRRTALRLLRTFGERSPWFYGCLATVMRAAATVEWAILKGQNRYLLYPALFTSNLAGVAEQDPNGDLVRRKLSLM